jgi:hypothetical protein
MTIQWLEARRRSTEQWRRILDSIGRRDPMAIVVELKRLGQVCEMATAAASGCAEPCCNCAVFGHASHCVDTRLDISAFLLNGELDKARAATMAVVERIAFAQPPELN